MDDSPQKYESRRKTAFFAVLFLVVCFSDGVAQAQDSIVIDDFEGAAKNDGLPAGWSPLTFRKIPRHSRYTLVREEGNAVVKAEADRSASGIYKKVDIDPVRFPILKWRWKVDHILERGDERTRAGDDYAARIYVTFAYDPDTASLWERSQYAVIKFVYGEYPPQGALNYIWANRLPKGRDIDNAYTDRAKMIAVESGTENSGRWMEEGVNLYEDYKRLFGKEPPHISGIALMTDTDNTGGSAIGYYDDIVLSGK
jgi:hypothetical protein